MRNRRSPISQKSVLRLVGVSLLASVATGCSSDVLRFQDGFYAGSDQMTTSSVQRQGGLAPMSNSGQSTQQAMASQNQSGGNPMAQPFPAAVPNYDQDMNYKGTYTGSIRTPSSRTVQSSALPPPTSSRAPSTATASAPAAASPQKAAAGWSSANGGSQVALRSGETIYTLSRRYGVPADAIMKANGISDATQVAAGQQIVIPTYNYGKNAPVSAPDADPRVLNASAAPQRAPEPAAPEQTVALATRPNDPKDGYGGTKPLSLPDQASAEASSGSTYTVQSGDTLTRIALKAGVSVDALKQANGISGSAIRIGQTLKLPEKRQETTPATASAPATAPKIAAAPKVETPKVTTQAQPKAAATEAKPAKYTPPSENKESVTEAPSGKDLASLTPESTGIGKLRWPVRGQVVAKFGSEQEGNRNDGIDISVPAGTPIKAAENGVVIYAGDGLKEYGNTVLIRHDSGLVTVYGYAKDLKVGRGDKVSRGQVIADSGMSGAADRPKLHFEVRKDASPVDPMGYLD